MSRSWYEYPELRDRERLCTCLRDGQTMREIADRLGCSRWAVETALKNHGFHRQYVSRMPEEVRG